MISNPQKLYDLSSTYPNQVMKLVQVVVPKVAWHRSHTCLGGPSKVVMKTLGNLGENGCYVPEKTQVSFHKISGYLRWAPWSAPRVYWIFRIWVDRNSWPVWYQLGDLVVFPTSLKQALLIRIAPNRNPAKNRCMPQEDICADSAGNLPGFHRDTRNDTCQELMIFVCNQSCFSKPS